MDVVVFFYLRPTGFQLKARTYSLDWEHLSHRLEAPIS